MKAACKRLASPTSPNRLRLHLAATTVADGRWRCPAEMAGHFCAGLGQLLGCQVVAELQISQTLAWRSSGGCKDKEDEDDLRWVVRLRTG